MGRTGRGQQPGPRAGQAGLARVEFDQIRAWDPEVIVTQNRTFARLAQTSPEWRSRRGGGRRRILLIPGTPFGWLDRPPSVNRLPTSQAQMACPAACAERMMAIDESLAGFRCASGSVTKSQSRMALDRLRLPGL